MLAPGAKAVFRDSKGKLEELEIPRDRKAAFELLSSKLPKGFFPLEGAGGVFRVQYGYRLLTSADEILKDLIQRRNDEIANINAVNRPVQFETKPIKRERWKALEKNRTPD